MNKNIDLSQLEQVFNYKEYLDYMESKKVRVGKEKTYTLLDFVTEEQRLQDKDNGIFDLSKYDPTPKEIQEHFNFVDRIIKELREQNPNDDFLNSLVNNESMQTIRVSYNWYTHYGIKK